MRVIDWREDRIGSALRGENPMVMAAMPSGFAVIGDTQHLPGYSLLICRDPTVNHLTDLDHRCRIEFLSDLTLIGRSLSTQMRHSLVEFSEQPPRSWAC